MLQKPSHIRILVAHDRFRGIGKNGTIPWKISEDLRRFRHLTKGNIVVMGRATYESIPEKYRPLPDRFNIVMTTRMPIPSIPSIPNLFYCNSMDSVKEQIEEICNTHGRKDVDIIGGSDIYRMWIPDVDILEITEVDGLYECDRVFPDYSNRFECVWTSPWMAEGYRFTRWLRNGRSL